MKNEKFCLTKLKMLVFLGIFVFTTFNNSQEQKSSWGRSFSAIPESTNTVVLPIASYNNNIKKAYEGKPLLVGYYIKFRSIDLSIEIILSGARCNMHIYYC